MSKKCKRQHKTLKYKFYYYVAELFIKFVFEGTIITLWENLLLFSYLFISACIFTEESSTENIINTRYIKKLKSVIIINIPMIIYPGMS